MIPRYSREKISYIWSDENMYNTWLKVEIATCEAWNELGIIPDKDLEKIKLIQFDMKKYDKYFEETKHDIIENLKKNEGINAVPSIFPKALLGKNLIDF